MTLNTSNASSLLSEELQATIVPMARESSELLSLPLRRQTGLSALSHKYILQTGGISPGFIAEGGEKPTSIPTFSQLELVPHECAAIVPWSDRLEMAFQGGLENWIRNEIAAAVRAKMEATLINGLAVNEEPVGLATVSLASGFEIAYTSGEIGDFLELGILRMRQANRNPSVIVMSPELVHELSIMRDQNDLALYPNVRESKVFKGLRIVETLQLATPTATQPETMALIIDRSMLWSGEWKQGGTLKSQTAVVELSGTTGTINLFSRDASALRWHSYVDWKLERNNGMVRLEEIPVSQARV